MLGEPDAPAARSHGDRDADQEVTAEDDCQRVEASQARAVSLHETAIGVDGFEPPTFRSQAECSTRLSYTPAASESSRTRRGGRFDHRDRS